MDPWNNLFQFQEESRQNPPEQMPANSDEISEYRTCSRPWKANDSLAQAFFIWIALNGDWTAMNGPSLVPLCHWNSGHHLSLRSMNLKFLGSALVRRWLGITPIRVWSEKSPSFEFGPTWRASTDSFHQYQQLEDVKGQAASWTIPKQKNMWAHRFSTS